MHAIFYSNHVIFYSNHVIFHRDLVIFHSDLNGYFCFKLYYFTKFFKFLYDAFVHVHFTCCYGMCYSKFLLHKVFVCSVLKFVYRQVGTRLCSSALCFVHFTTFLVKECNQNKSNHLASIELQLNACGHFEITLHMASILVS